MARANHRWRPRLPKIRTTRDRVFLGAGVAILAAALAAGGVLIYQANNQSKQITAYFRQTIGVYPGSSVRVLGVPVGKVNAVHPEGTQVKVTMTINSGVPVPASAKAVVVSASVVADRYVQLTPAYTSGPQIANGANKHGALNDLIRTGAANMAGNGAYLHSMITQFSALSKTLGDSSGNLYATIAYLEQFTHMLKTNDGQVRLAEQQLSSVTGFLASDRQNLAAALSQLATALGQVQSFIATNRSLITSNVTKLAAIVLILVKERSSLAETLDVAPLAVDNVVNAYNATNRTLTGRGNLNELSMGPGAQQLGATAPVGAGASGPAGAVPLPPSSLHKLPPLPLPAVGLYGTPEAALAGGR